MKGNATCCAVLAVFVSGCSVAEWVSTTFPPIDEYDWRSSSWVFDAGPAGPTSVTAVGELLTERGPPDLILEARPRYGEYRYGIPELSYVYRPAAGRDCYDTYVVVAATGRVSRYYCR